MRLFVVLMVVFLQVHFLLLLASKSSTLDIPQHSSVNETEALAEDGRLHIAVISKKGGGGGGRGGGRGSGRGGGRGGGRGRGGSGGRASGRGGMLPFYGAAGAAAGATAAHSSHTHHRGSTCRSARLVLTLPSLLVGLGIFLVQF